VRIFIALDIDEGIRERIRTFMAGVRGFGPDVGWVREESLHVTLKFMGDKPPKTVEKIRKALAGLHGQPIEIAFRGYGFFPTPEAPRVFWVGIQASKHLSELAAALDVSAAALGMPEEDRAFSPHLTLARRRGGSGAPRRNSGDGPNTGFQRLQQKLAAMPTPEFGTMTAREFFLYESQLSRNGARYTKLERFVLRESHPATGAGRQTA